ncbi:MAG: hypothetical protein LBG60_10415, partial [Bifidobacteriaceae bacterium]|nr:hypothetical protein [Bifidobacteriaceae bacterium]
MRRRIVWWGLYGVFLAAPALFWGLATARADYSFGPHEATYEVTLDSRLTVDLGPLGSAVAPSRMLGPLGFLGGRVVVGPIPADLTSPEVPAAALAQDLAEYGEAYLGIEQTVRQAVAELAADALIRAGVAWGGALAATALAGLALGRARRTQWTMWARRR